MGDVYAEAIGKGLQVNNRPLKIVQLSGNRMGCKGATPFMKTFSTELTELDLSKNPNIGPSTYLELGKFLINPGNKL